MSLIYLYNKLNQGVEARHEFMIVSMPASRHYFKCTEFALIGQMTYVYFTMTFV